MTTTVDDAMRVFAPALPLAVAYSGGADSTALLLACADKWPGQVSAVHVHHGLQAAADDFVAHCQAACAMWQIPLQVLRVQAGHAPGESPEDAARKARYEAFRALAHEGQAPAAIKNIALAQHADDQVETILLALSRGAGLPGLSAMPASWQRDGLSYHRPLLAVPATEIRAWLVRRCASFIEDPTNTDERFTRNRIRARLLPVLGDTFPQFRETFARSARHAAEAQALLLEVAREDLLAVGNPPALAALQELSQPRQANLLRHWLQASHRATPSAAQLAQLLAQIAACTTRGHQIHLKVAAGHITRAGAHLRYAA
ncbi:MAG: tRNA lysidine(34) synthetase TilS [Hydrogenophaga sp.]|uniref:tRNA lysidine(34) synthetase TilS n=1 Tax=Polaromonas sp. TaxID=1869339 RepID=UPI00273220BA|nr:tRNA lysidine(34) synthetase TilS [Polaromonas sp.]MDP1742535.1 tRNA lysidine(34) synthetase TilS [Polaromonas sp.]MDP3166124.1 tRNA lysidine(34) synthetase TilS [Hydrogenophaga sp.]